MTMVLSREQEEMAERLVRDGACANVAEAVTEALRLLSDHAAKREALRLDIDLALDQSAKGQGVPLTRDVFDKVEARGRDRLANHTPQSGRG
jgi:Arc/MetJ-type ribon-helix-helix transcriptional regulator